MHTKVIISPEKIQLIQRADLLIKAAGEDAQHGSHDNAIKKYQKALKIYEELGITLQIVETSYKLAKIYSECRMIADRLNYAMDMYEKIKVLNTEGEQNKNILNFTAAACLYLGNLMQDFNKKQEAGFMYEKARAVWEKIGSESNKKVVEKKLALLLGGS